MSNNDIIVSVQENQIAVSQQEGATFATINANTQHSSIVTQQSNNAIQTSMTAPNINNSVYNQYFITGNNNWTGVVSLNNLTGALLLSGLGSIDIINIDNVLYLSGMVVPDTGNLISAFYPLNQNPSNYIQSSQTGVISTISRVNASGQSLLNQIKNLSGYYKTSAVEFIIDGGGYPIETGMKGYLEIPYNCSIAKNTMLADASGVCIVDIWKCSYANFNPPIHPASGDKITSGTPPTIQNGFKSQDVNLVGWTKSISSGDILGFNVNSCSGINRVTLSLLINL